MQRSASRSGQRSTSSREAGKAIVRDAARKREALLKNASAARSRNIKKASMGSSRNGYWDIYNVQQEQETSMNGKKPKDKYNVSTTGRKAGPPRPVYPSSSAHTAAKRNENDVYDPITGDLMISSEGYPDLLPHDAPKFLNRRGFTNNTHTKVDPITGEVMMDKQQFLEFYKPGMEEAKSQWNPERSKIGYGAAYVGYNDPALDTDRKYHTFLEQGGQIRAQIEPNARRDNNIITWRADPASKFNHEPLPSVNASDDISKIQDLITMDGVTQTKGGFSGVRTKVGGWPDAVPESALVKAYRDEVQYEPPVKGVSIVTRNPESDLALRERKAKKSARDTEILSSKPNMRASDLRFQVPVTMQ